MWQGYRAGLQASWLPAEDWEGLLALPIEQVRKQLNIEEPSKYIEKYSELRNLATI